jgi:hypothetical protein
VAIDPLILLKFFTLRSPNSTIGFQSHTLGFSCFLVVARRPSGAKSVETRRERGGLKEAAAKAVETKRESGVLKEEAEKAAATRKREREK